MLWFYRYDNISDNLEKSERERLFDEHIDNLVAKKKENYRKLLDEQKGIALDSNFKDIKKLIRDDPRYSRYVFLFNFLKYVEILNKTEKSVSHIYCYFFYLTKPRDSNQTVIDTPLVTDDESWKMTKYLIVLVHQ